jgi:release factor glutamine methyltransferase
MLKICQALSWGIEELEKAGIDSAGLDAEILLIATLRDCQRDLTLDKSFLYTHPELELTKSQEKKYKSYIARRAKGEPVAYILGHKEFFGLDFLVNKNVLVPRPETEILVEEVIKQLTVNSQQLTKNKRRTEKCQTLIIDIGTGSGCLIISILKKLLTANCWLLIDAVATDISTKALAVAKKNARRHGLDKKIKFIKSDLFSFLCHSREGGLPAVEAGNPEKCFLDPGSRPGMTKKQIIITANLPYLPEKIYKENYQGLRFEPRLALVAKKNGLMLYDKLLKQVAGYPPLSSPEANPSFGGEGRRGGVVIGNNNHPVLDCCRDTPPSKGGDKSQITLLFELLPFQKPLLKKLIKKYLPKAKITFKKDLAKKWRVAIIEI